MTERDIAPEPDAEGGVGGSGASAERSGAPSGTLPRQSSSGAPAGSPALLDALTESSPIRVVRQPVHRTAAIRRDLAEKAAATDELREALDELRQVLDVEKSPPQPGGDHRRNRLLLLVLAAFAAIGLIAYLVLDHDPAPIVRSAGDASASGAPAASAPVSPSSPAAVTSAPAASAPAGAATVRPLPWPGGAVIVPPGLTRVGPGADAPGTDVQAAVDADGTHVDVVERLVLDGPTSDPLVLVTLSLPALGQTRVDDLQVQLDDEVVPAAGADDATSWTASPRTGQSYTRATLRYRIGGGIVKVTPAAPGRAFALVTPLTAAISQAHGHAVLVRTVDPHVVGVSCPAVEGLGSVCGTRTPGGGWTATLPDASRAIVLLQVNR